MSCSVNIPVTLNTSPSLTVVLDTSPDIDVVLNTSPEIPVCLSHDTFVTVVSYLCDANTDYLLDAAGARIYDG